MRRLVVIQNPVRNHRLTLACKTFKRVTAITTIKTINNDNNNNNNMRSFVIGALGTVTKGLAKGLEDLEIRGQVETLHAIVLLRSARILRRALET